LIVIYYFSKIKNFISRALFSDYCLRENARDEAVEAIAFT